MYGGQSLLLTFLERRLKNPKEQLLRNLNRAIRVFPLQEMSLESACPISLEMETGEAYSYLRQSAPYWNRTVSVLLPSW